MRTRLMVLLLCGLQLLTATALATDKVVHTSRFDQAPVALTEYFAVLEDPGLGLTLADVQQPDIAARFAVPAAAEGLTVGFTRSAYWLRLVLRNDTDQTVQRMLEIGHARLSSVQLHQPSEDGAYRALITGSRLPMATRPYANRLFVFPLTLPARSEQTIFLRLESVPSLVVSAQLWTPAAFEIHARNDYFGQAWYFGIVTAMLSCST